MLRGQAFRKYVYKKQLNICIQKYLSYILGINFFAEQTLSYQIGISNQRERERDIGFFITLVPKVLVYRLWVLIMNFDWLDQ